MAGARPGRLHRARDRGGHVVGRSGGAVDLRPPGDLQLQPDAARHAPVVGAGVLDVELLPPRLPRAERRRAACRADNRSRAGGAPTVTRGVEASADAEGVDDLGAEEPCPLSGTHSRLNQAHALWHEALDAYDDPERFVTKLNALIEAMRNVTFVLQNELADLSDVREDWYPAWQDDMRSDSRLKWLIGARNLVVHQGDLETHSKARAQIVGELIEGRSVDLDISPVAPAHAVMRELMLSALDDRVCREGTLVIERRWVVDEFPNDELLELLAHCFAVLSELVADGHEQLGTSMEGWPPRWQKTASSRRCASPKADSEATAAWSAFSRKLAPDVS